MKLLIPFILLITLISCNHSEKKLRVLPFVGNYDIVYSMVNGKEVADTVYPKMIDFSYLNQDSILIHSSEMKGKIWIADFFFTSCPTICPTKRQIPINIKVSAMRKGLRIPSSPPLCHG